ncbi:MAG TPA: hypothetical protein VM713_06390, partial [Steroidobacteraceae bacterium]|nr:hypothetical protein [Steroidobacteraceae bacterium]
MRVGVLELLTDSQNRGYTAALYARYYRRQFMSIMPQVVAVWCRQLGHRVSYATYCGNGDPRSLLPDDLDVVFIAVYTQASALAYALAKLYRRAGVLTVIGGPHAKCFPADCLRFFDVVVKDCDRALIDDILRGRVDAPAIVTSGRSLASLPSVEERMPEIAASAFTNGRPTLTSLVPLLASVGCPYSCGFCIDWNTNYVPMPRDQLQADLAYLARNYPGVLVGYHDPNFAVRFDETMDVIETIPSERRNRYIMESSLSVLKPARLHRLRATRCVYVAPGIESWADFSDKSAVGAKSGRSKLDQVVAHLSEIRRHVPGLQANFIFGTDADHGEEPVELTKEFIRRLPFVFPAVNIPTPFGGTPLFDHHLAEGRILRAMPFAFYYNPYLVTTLPHYGPVEYYRHLIDIHASITSTASLVRRLSAGAPPAMHLVHTLRTFAVASDLGEMRWLYRQLIDDRAFRAFHEGRSDRLPDYYQWRFRERLGVFADQLSWDDLIPRLDA